jgi:hypothetical protein
MSPVAKSSSRPHFNQSLCSVAAAVAGPATWRGTTTEASTGFATGFKVRAGCFFFALCVPVFLAGFDVPAKGCVALGVDLAGTRWGATAGLVAGVGAR